MSWEGDILKKLRKERELTQAQFAEWLEIPKRTYEKWESGESVPPTWVVKLIQFKCEKSTQGEQLEIKEIKDCCKNCKNANIISENLIECCIYGLKKSNSICQSGMYVFQQNKANKATQSEQIRIKENIVYEIYDMKKEKTLILKNNKESAIIELQNYKIIHKERKEDIILRSYKRI